MCRTQRSNSLQSIRLYLDYTDLLCKATVVRSGVRVLAVVIISSSSSSTTPRERNAYKHPHTKQVEVKEEVLKIISGGTQGLEGS